jgi:hypothetical protein
VTDVLRGSTCSKVVTHRHVAAASRDLTRAVTARTSAHNAIGASTQRRAMRLRALYAVLGATPLSRAPPLVRANVTREPSPRSLALRLLRTARSALGVPSNFKEAWPSAMYVQLAASLTKRGHKHASSATTIHTVTLQGHPIAPHVQSERWRSPREASNASSQYLAAQDSIVPRALRLATLVLRGQGA